MPQSSSDPVDTEPTEQAPDVMAADGAQAPMPDARRRAGLMNAFNSAHPVVAMADLYGREEQLTLLRETVLGQQQHALIYGARGSGKTSLVRVFGQCADEDGAVVIYLACSDQRQFADLMRPYLDELAAERGTVTRAAVERLRPNFTPREAASLVAGVGRSTLFILDEFDRVTDLALRADIAAFMKLLSDALSPVRLIIVGIGRTAGEMIGHHSSLRRHMICVPVGRIGRVSGCAMIEAGADRVEMRFTPDAVDQILRLSCGSPFHIRLFALQAGLEALRRGDENIGRADVDGGAGTARRRWAQIDPAASDLFDTLVQAEGTQADILSQIAVLAATRDGFGDDDLAEALPGYPADQVQAALDALAPTLDQISATPPIRQFKDSLAPQFLLLAASRRRGDLSPGATIVSFRGHAA